MSSHAYPVWKTTELERRRAIVSSLSARGLSPSKILDEMLDEEGAFYYEVPEDGTPLTRQLIIRDLRMIQRAYRRISNRKITDYRADQMMELAEITRAAWNSADPELALKALNVKVRITGTAAPLTASLTEDLKAMIAALQDAGMDVQELIRRITREAHNLKESYALNHGGKDPLGLPGSDLTDYLNLDDEESLYVDEDDGSETT